MGYPENQIYCHAIQSQIVNTKMFLYKATGDLLPDDVPAGYYVDYNAAKNAAKAFDTKQLPLFVGNTIIKFFYSTGSSSPIEVFVAPAHVGTLSQTNKTAVPYFSVQDETTPETIEEAKGAKADVLNLYNISDRITLVKPSGYSDSEFALLMANLNNTFGINLPAAAATYNFNKVTGQWEKATI